MNKGFLFATSSQKIKSHVVESQTTLLVWPCLSLTEKQRTFNHKIIFNDSISKFPQCSIRGFSQGISIFFSICLAKKNCILFSYFFCSLISVSKKWNMETMLTLPYSYNWLKFNNKMNKKRSQEYQSMDPEYVTGQINSCILELPFRRFCCLILAPSRKS